jgi:hypothetical protein
MPEERRLRSREKPLVVAAHLFDFDNANPYVFADKPIQIVHISSQPDTDASGVKQSVHKPKRKPAVEYVKAPDNTRKSKLRSDQLSDDYYTPFHTYMTKREVSMVNQDNTKVLSDMDTLNLQKNELMQLNWSSKIQGITHINNPRDIDELTRKKRLTLVEINRRLAKFRNWKKRQEELKNEIKFQERTITQQDPADEFSMSLSELKQLRKKERLQKYGGVINLRLNNGYYLRIDPYSPPQILESFEYKKSQLLELEAEPKSIKKRGRQPKTLSGRGKQILKQRTLDDVVTIKRGRRPGPKPLHSRLNDAKERMKRSTKRARKPGPKPKLRPDPKPKLKPGPKPKSRPGPKPGPKPRSKPGPKAGRPGPKSGQKKPGPKPKTTITNDMKRTFSPKTILRTKNNVV